MLKREFERTYGADLLPVTAADIHLGDLWDWQGVFSNRLTRMLSRLPHYFPEPHRSSLDNDLKSVQFENASLAAVEISSDFHTSADLKIPSINLDLEGEIDVDSVKMFAFKNIKSKSIVNLRAHLNDQVSALKDQNFDSYKKSIRGSYIAAWLFYADSVEIQIDKNASGKAAVEARLSNIVKSSAMDLKVDTSHHSVISYTVSGSTCPFAAQFIAGRDF